MERSSVPQQHCQATCETIFCNIKNQKYLLKNNRCIEGKQNDICLDLVHILEESKMKKFYIRNVQHLQISVTTFDS